MSILQPWPLIKCLFNSIQRSCMKAFNYVSMRLLVFDNVEYSYNDSCSGQKKLKLSFKIRKEYLILAMGTELHVCKIVQIWHFNNVF